jgi:NAD(P)-dependent dehydrogenase (short-subunit alcohol dehydrogenase family)
VVVADYFEDRAVEVSEAVAASGGTAIPVSGDVSSAASLDAFVQASCDAFGRIDVMVNNAGIFDQNAPCVETTEDLWDRVLSIDLKSVFLGTKRALLEMLPMGRGSIINMSSISGLVGLCGGTAYTAAKHGVVGLTKQVACEVASQGVRVNAIAPGLVHTSLELSSAAVLGEATPTGPLTLAAGDAMRAGGLAAIPLGRGAEPMEVAHAAVFLASEQSSYVTGQVITVDGGYVAR